MNIIIGSKNPEKVGAVREAIQEFISPTSLEIEEIGVQSGVSAQPKTLDETIQGAIARALAAYESSPGYDLAFGIESGLIFLQQKKRYLEQAVCAVYDGKEFYFGLSPGFELPQDISEIIEREGVEIDVAVRRTGMSENPRIGYSEGIIGILSEGKITRKDQMKQSVLMALLYLPKK